MYKEVIVRTVATLPPAASMSGGVILVNDSTLAEALNVGTIAVGGGGYRARVYSDGVSWRIGNWGSGAAAATASPVIAWASAVARSGGTVSPARYAIVDAFIKSEMASGTWALTDDYWPLWGENVTQSLLSLKRHVMAGPVDAPVFTASRGYAFNGSTQYIDTAFSPRNQTLYMDINNNRIAVYERTHLASLTVTAGSTDGSNRSMLLRPYSNVTTVIPLLVGGGAQFTPVPLSSLGYTAGSRNGIGAGGGDIFAYKNGVALVRTIDQAATGNQLPASTIWIGTGNSNGTPTGPRAASVGFVTISAYFTPEQELAQYNNVLAWATAIGANV